VDLYMEGQDDPGVDTRHFVEVGPIEAI
jgi:hypothetical protein